MRNKSIIRVAGIVLSTILACASSAEAGGLFGDLHIQNSFAALPGTELQLCSADGSLVANGAACFVTITGSDGSFYIPDVPTGQYNVVTQSGGGMTSGTVFVPDVGDVGISVVSP